MNRIFLIILLSLLALNLNAQRNCINESTYQYRAYISAGIGIIRNNAIKMSLGFRPYKELPWSMTYLGLDFGIGQPLSNTCSNYYYSKNYWINDRDSIISDGRFYNTISLCMGIIKDNFIIYWMSGYAIKYKYQNVQYSDYNSSGQMHTIIKHDFWAADNNNIGVCIKYMPNNWIILGLAYTKIEGINATIGIYFNYKDNKLNQFKKDKFIGKFNANSRYYENRYGPGSIL